MLVPGQRKEGIPPVHEITAEQGVRVDDGGQRMDDGPSVEVDHKVAEIAVEAEVQEAAPGRCFFCRNRLIGVYSGYTNRSPSK